MSFLYVPFLKEICKDLDHVTEFGVREAYSTCAIIDGLRGRFATLVSYDIDAPAVGDIVEHARANEVNWVFHQEDTLTTDPIVTTDLLFLDSAHTYDQVKAELERHASRVKRFLVFDDVTIFGKHGDPTGNTGYICPGVRGIMPAIQEFRDANPFWTVHTHKPEGCGLLCLERTSRCSEIVT